MNQSVVETLMDLASQVRGPGGKAAQDELESRYPELEAAIVWLGEQGRTDDAVRLVGTLAPFRMAVKRLQEGCDWFDHALALPGGSEAVRGNACFQAGLLATWRGDDELAVARHREAVAIGREHGLTGVAAQALTGLARVALRSSDTAEARRLCREALDLTAGTDERVARSNALHVMGVAAQMAGDLLEARELMGERLAMARELGQLAAVSSEAGNLSMVERQLGNLDRAEELALESLTIDRDRGDSWSVPWRFNSLAAIALERGQLERAAALVGAAEASVAAQGAAWPPDEGPQYQQTLAALQERMPAGSLAAARGAGAALDQAAAVEFALGSSD